MAALSCHGCLPRHELGGSAAAHQEGNGSPAEFSTSVSVYALSSRESAKGVKESKRTVFCNGESGSPPYVVYSGLAQSKLARKFIEEQGRHTPEERSASVPHLNHGQTRRRIRRQMQSDFLDD